MIIIYGMWSNPAHGYNHQQSEALDYDTPDATSDLHKSVLHCIMGEKAPHNLPNLIGHFFGRSNSVQNITWYLLNKNISGIRAVGIYGSPAVGKSTLAIHTAHVISECGIEVRYIDLFDTHNHSESTESVPVTSSPDPWASTSPGPVLFETPNDRKKALSLSAQGLLEWDKGVKKDTLLVLDNCDNILGIEEHGQKLKELITLILKQSSPTLRLIVTSRQKIAIPGLGFKTYYLRELDNESAIQLLLKSNHLLSENDGKRIAALVDNNPLALHICASVIDETYSSNQLIAGLIDTPMDALSADILPDSRKMVQVLYLSYKHLHNTTRFCGHYLSLFPGSFAEDAAINVLSTSYFSNPEGCLRSLRDRSLITPYERAGQLRYQYHRLVKEFFNYMLENGNDLEFDAVVKMFQTSFELYFSSQLYNMTHTPWNEKMIGTLEYDSHNFITLLELVAIHPPLSVESVYLTAHSLVKSDLVLNIITENKLFRSLKAISHVLLYNNNEVVPILGNEMANFWAKIFTRLHTIALSSTTFSECRTLCMETFEFPSNVSSVIYDIMAIEYYVPRFAMYCDWLVCWSGAGCIVNITIRQWLGFLVIVVPVLVPLLVPLCFVISIIATTEHSTLDLFIIYYGTCSVITCIYITLPELLMFAYVYNVIIIIINQDLCRCNIQMICRLNLVPFVYAITFVMALGMGGLMLTTLTPIGILGLLYIHHLLFFCLRFFGSCTGMCGFLLIHQLKYWNFSIYIHHLLCSFLATYLWVPAFLNIGTFI